MPIPPPSLAAGPAGAPSASRGARRKAAKSPRSTWSRPTAARCRATSRASTSVRLYVPELGLMQPRQYSLSGRAGAGTAAHLRSARAGVAGAPAGRVSNALHDRLRVGGVLDVAPPQGDFQLREAGGAPVVLLSGGVGLTPMVSMLNLVRADDGRQIRFVHGCRNRDAHAMRDHVNTIAAGRAMCARRSSMRKWAAGTSRAATTTTPAASTCAPSATPPSCRARTTTCAARESMRAPARALLALGVSADRIHAEAFGSGGAPA